MIDREHLDRVERFALWLETRRQQAGLTQRELAEMGGMSHSYYSKIIHIGQIRRTHGDSSREVTAPRRFETFDKALDALEARVAGSRQEAEEVWSGLQPREEPQMTHNRQATSEDAQALADATRKLLSLSGDNLRLVSDLIDRLK